jgi:hypothetical protein
MKIGLFGTCGKSIWRERFVNAYKERHIDFYNPQLADGEWTADRADEFVKIENKNLKTNEIVLFPVTDETTGQGSLAEIGFSILDTIRNLNDRYLIVFIDDDCKDPSATKNQIEESKRSRKLVKSKVIQHSFENERIFIVNNFDKMLELTFHIKNLIDMKTQINENYTFDLLTENKKKCLIG